MPADDLNGAQLSTASAPPSTAPAALALAPVFRSARARNPTIREQINAAPPAEIRSREVDGLPRLRVYAGPNQGDYILESWVHNRRSRRSWINEYGEWLVLVTPTGLGETYWACGRCDNKRKYRLFAVVATSSASRHLKNAHRITEQGGPTVAATASGTPIVLSQLQRMPITHTAAAEFKSDLLRLVIDADLSFTIVEKPAFRRLLSRANNTISTLLPKSSRTIKNWIDRQYNLHLAQITLHIQSRLSRIHVSFDLWTSAATQAYLSVVFYYVDTDCKRHTRLVALERVFGTHSGENQAAVLLTVLQRYGVCDPSILGFFMADNADSCDTCIRAVLRSTQSSRSTAEKAQLEQLYRCRCIGHILNLAAKAFLAGKDTEEDYPDDSAVDLQVVQAWRKRRPVGKLHNLVHWVRRSPKRKDKFMSYSTGTAVSDLAGGLLDADEPPPGLVLVSDNATRWNSTLAMILRAIRIRSVLDVFCAVSQAERKEEDRMPAEDILNDEDWHVLTELVAILQPLWRLTKRFEGNTYLRFGGGAPQSTPIARPDEGAVRPLQ